MKSGRTSDSAVAWYCHMRLNKLERSGMNQKQIAEATNVPRSAVNVAMKSAKGIGPATAAAFVRLFGFDTRGELVDAADEWYAGEGKDYVIANMQAMHRAELDKQKADIEAARAAGPAKPKRKKSA